MIAFYQITLLKTLLGNEMNGKLDCEFDVEKKNPIKIWHNFNVKQWQDGF